MLTGIGALALIICGVALARAADSAISLWWLRRQRPAPPPGRYESRVWVMDCRYREHKQSHPAHRWVRSAWTTGGVPTSHPNWCAGYADAPGRPGHPSAR